MLKTYFKTILLIIVVFNSCNLQKSNSRYIGNEPFDLDQITFKENLDTLMRNIKHIKIPLKRSDHYEKQPEDTTLKDTLGIVYRIIDKELGSSPFYFLDQSFTQNRLVSFIADDQHKLVSFDFFIASKYPFDSILEKISDKYRKYEVDLKEDLFLKNRVGAETYQWETSEKIIALYRTIKMYSGEYFCYMIVVDNKSYFKSIANRVIVSAADLCLEESCKE